MSGSERRRGRPKAAQTTKTASTRSKSKRAGKQGHVCPEAGCGKVCATAAGLASHRRQTHRPTPPQASVSELPTVAAERLLGSVEITPNLAVLAATIRQLAAALEACEPTDKAKTSKELIARVNEFLGDPSRQPDEPDWTEGVDE